MFIAIGILAGTVGLCLVPVLLRRLFGDKEFLVTILSTAVASAIFFCARVVLPQIFTGVFGVYLGVIIINICTTVGYRHKRKDGEMDKRYSAKNNPFIRGRFFRAMWRATISIAITYVYQLFTGGDVGPLGLILGFFGGFFAGIYEIFKVFFQ
jgi:uncharacterized membrane protein SpoIIM required for sporulation